MSQAATSHPSSAFIFKASSCTLTSLQLLSLDYPTLNAELETKVQQAPKFFNNTPVVIDLSKISMVPVELDFAKVMHIIRQHHLIPVGIRGGTPDQQGRALAHGLAVFSQDKQSAAPEVEAPEVAQPAPAVEEAPLKATSKVITQPVRSGQQVYARGGDLIITAPVSAGAEVLADGHIHIYGPLRGRALAGVNGDTSARIFCSCLEAELVSVAGQYCVSEDLRESSWGTAATITLKGDHLQITPLS